MKILNLMLKSNKKMSKNKKRSFNMIFLAKNKNSILFLEWDSNFNIIKIWKNYQQNNE